jgi:putative glutamine amidotransferase
VSRPRIAVVAHRRELESPLGRYKGAVVDERFLARLDDAGADPVVMWPAMSGHLMDVVDGVLLIGGGDVAPTAFGSVESGESIDNERDSLEMELVEACRTDRVPLLGVCRGAQVLNVALGGTLRKVSGHRQDLPLTTPDHDVEIHEGSRLGELVGVGTMMVNSYHAWAVDRAGADLSVVARGSDGTIEAIESTEVGWWCIGVQWHTEMLERDYAASPFLGLVEAARRSS